MVMVPNVTQIIALLTTMKVVGLVPLMRSPTSKPSLEVPENFSDVTEPALSLSAENCPAAGEPPPARYVQINGFGTASVGSGYVPARSPPAGPLGAPPPPPAKIFPAMIRRQSSSFKPLSGIVIEKGSIQRLIEALAIRSPLHCLPPIPALSPIAQDTATRSSC